MEGYPLFDARLPADKVVAVLAHVTEGSAPARPHDWWASTGTRSPDTSAGPADTPRTGTTNSWPFPPAASDVPFDETWAFAGRKEKHGAPDEGRGDGWGHVALDPETRRVVSLVVGKRAEGAAHARVRDIYLWTGGRVVQLMTSDEYPA